MDRLVALHANLLFTILAVLGVLAIWGLAGAWRARLPGNLYLSCLAIGELLLVSEALIGVALFVAGLRPARPELHIVYAVVAVAALPVAHRYVRDRPPRQRWLTYALTCVFLCAVVLRGVETGSAEALMG
ncbi:MAG TPA: hypothetical protein VNL77_25045 [Roseiflexaceae bacterium]|nr:hypothetical protein [Roseiflexaceae bacterium]